MTRFILQDDDVLPASFFSRPAEVVAPELLGTLLVAATDLAQDFCDFGHVEPVGPIVAGALNWLS